MEGMIRWAEKVEAILRDHGMHGPDCPIRVADRANARGLLSHTPDGPCDCWLSKGPQ